MWAMIVALESVRPSVLITSSAQAQTKDESTTSVCPAPIAAKPGRRMIKAPMKPTSTAVQRRGPTISPRIRAASSVVKIGAVSRARPPPRAA
jgi:hypothetical protein